MTIMSAGTQLCATPGKDAASNDQYCTDSYDDESNYLLNAGVHFFFILYLHYPQTDPVDNKRH